MRSLVLIADEPANVARMRLATRYAAGVRVVATLDGREPVAAEIAALAPDVVVVDAMCQRINTLTRLQEVRDSGASFEWNKGVVIACVDYVGPQAALQHLAKA